MKTKSASTCSILGLLLRRVPSYYEDSTEEGADPGETRVQETVGCRQIREDDRY